MNDDTLIMNASTVSGTLKLSTYVKTIPIKIDSSMNLNANISKFLFVFIFMCFP